MDTLPYVKCRLATFVTLSGAVTRCMMLRGGGRGRGEGGGGSPAGGIQRNMPGRLDAHMHIMSYEQKEETPIGNAIK